MPNPFEKDFYTSGKGTDIWDIATQGRSSEGVKNFIGDSFVGDYFMGPTRAAREQKKASKKAEGTTRQSMDEAMGYMSPYEQTGRQHFQSLSDDITGGRYDMDPSSFGYQGREMPGQYQEKQFRFEEDPGYQFRLKEGEKAIKRMAAARGSTGSGAYAKELMRYGQGLASEEYGKARGRYERDRAFGYGKYSDEYGRATGERAFDYGTATDDYNRRLSALQGQYGRQAGMANIGVNTAGNLAQTRMTGGANIANAMLGVGNAGAAQQMAMQNTVNPIINTVGQIGGMMAGGMAGGPAGAMAGNQAGGNLAPSNPTGTTYGQSGYPNRVPLQYK